jgi:transcriptional regulator with XRE-family HTH domain
VRRGLSLERLAQRAGVSRGMLSQIELGRSAPTINILWKIAAALNVTFSTLLLSRESRVRVLRHSQASRLASEGGALVSRALFPTDAPARVEFYEIELGSRSEEQVDPYPTGTTVNLVVARGEVELDAGGEAFTLGPGDAVTFGADTLHAYRNTGAQPARLYLVIVYAIGSP